MQRVGVIGLGPIGNRHATIYAEMGNAVSAEVKDPAGVDPASLLLWYRVGNGAWNSVPMQAVLDARYWAAIPGQAAASVREIEQRTGRAASPTEVAAAMDVSVPEYMRLMEDATRGHVLSLESHIEDNGEPRLASNGGPTPEKLFEQEEFREQLIAAIDQLPERERLVLSLYYEQELNLKEIGAVLGVSESRVCQIHGQAMVRLRGRLSVYESADARLEQD